MDSGQRSILIIYTGGTIGMVQNQVNGSLQPLNFDQISDQVPELRKFGYCPAYHILRPPHGFVGYWTGNMGQNG